MLDKKYNNQNGLKLSDIPEQPNVGMSIDEIVKLTKIIARQIDEVSNNPKFKRMYCNNYRKMHGLPMRRKVRR